jgi:hypothetical protein
MDELDPLAIVTGGLVATPPRQLERRRRLAARRAEFELELAARLRAGGPRGERLRARLAVLADEPHAPGTVQDVARRAIAHFRD